MLTRHRAPLVCLAAAGLVLACAPARPGGPGDLVARALTAPPQLGAESRIDDPVFTEQSGEQSLPFIAPGGPGAIVVWRDDTRPGFSASNRPPSFARLDANGNLLDQLPIAITPPNAENMSFAPGMLLAGWNGDVALVVWNKTVVGGSEMQGSRVTRDGAVLDPGTTDFPGGIDVALTPASRTLVAVVPLGNDFLVFWLGSDGSRVARVGRDGSVPTPGGNPIGFPADGVQRAVLGAVAVTGGALLTVADSSQFKLMKVDANGAALSPLSEAGGVAGPGKSAIASSGGGAIACWSQSTAAGQPVTLYGRRATADGAWIDAAAFELRAAGAAVGQVGAVWDGSRYVCSWTESGARVRATLRAIAASGTPVTEAAVGPTAFATAPVLSVQVEWTGSRYLAAMARTVYSAVGGLSAMDHADGVLVRGLGADLKPLGTDATVVTRQPNEQPSFRAVGTSAAAHVVWQDDRARGDVGSRDEENLDTYAARVVVSGGVPAKTVTPLLTGPDSQVEAGVGWDGTQFTVAYLSASSANGADRYLQHVSAQGTPTGSPITVPQDTRYGSSALPLWNGQTFLVAALYNSGAGLGGVTFYRVSAAGAFLDAKTTVVNASISGLESSDLQGVTIGGKFLLIYQWYSRPAGLPTDEYDVMGLVVNADGTLLVTTPTVIAGGAGGQDNPAVASDGTSALVVWRDRGGAAPRLMGARLDANLTRLDASDAVIVQATAPDTLGAPALAWTGSEYIATWTRTSGGSGTVAFAGCRLGADRLCAPGSETSVPSDIAVATGPDGGAPPGVGPGATDDVRGPSLVWTDAGGVLFYRRLDTAPYVNKERVFLRAVQVSGAPPPDGGAGSGGGGSGGGGAGGVGGAAAGGRGGASGGAASGGRGGASGGSGGASGGGAGTAGASGTTGGSAETTGAGGTSGGSAGTTGTGGANGNRDGGADSGKPPSSGGGGCGCAMGEGTAPAAPLSLLALALTVRRARRRR